MSFWKKIFRRLRCEHEWEQLWEYRGIMCYKAIYRCKKCGRVQHINH